MNKQRKTSHILNVFQYDPTTGAVTLPASLSLATPDSTDNSTKVATTAWIRAYVGSLSYATASSVTTAIANLVASAPTTLDTLNELATALGNDPNFATTITTSIGTKVPQSRTITINGTAYDLSADRAWTIASGVTSFNTRTGAIVLSSADVTGALGFTPYNATNPNGYISGITSAMVTGALGYTPYNSSNPSGYISGITSLMVTNALGFTPYNSSNPAGYITASALSPYLPLAGGNMTGNLRLVSISGNDQMVENTYGAYLHLGGWAVGRTDATAILVNTAYRADYADALFDMNISRFTNNSGYLTSVSWSGVTGKPSNVMYYQGFTLNADTMDGNSTGFTYAVNAPWTGPIARFSETGYSLQLNAAYGGGGTSMSFRTRNGDAGTWNSWRYLLTDNNYNSYAPTLTGGGASGTWGINVTGTANNITAYTINQSVGTGNSPSFAEGIFGTTGGATNQGIQIRYQNYTSGYGRIRFYQSDSNHMTIHAFSDSWQGGGFGTGNSAGAINIAGGAGVTFGGWNSCDAYIASGGAGWFRTSVTAQNYFYASGSIRLGDMWNSTGGLYRPSGIMAFGTENEGWRFTMANDQKAYIGTDGNIWMKWSGEYLSTTLDRKAVHRGEGVNYVDYSRYVYNNGAYSGSGWIEPSDLGVRYAGTAGYCSGRAELLSSWGGCYNNSHPGYGLRAWYDWNNCEGYKNGITIGSHPSDQAYGFMLWQDMWNDRLYTKRYNGGWQSVRTILNAQDDPYAYNMNQYVRTTDGPTFQTTYINDWVRTRYESGIYFESYSAGLRSAYQASFGQVATYGTARSSHGGYVIVNNYVTNLMQNTSGDFGFFSDNDWAWRLFYNRGNNCWGIGTDNTYSGDGFRCIKYGSAQYGWTTWSDRRAKENISSITGALDTVLAMRGVYFNYIQDEAKNKRVGFIAQELEQVLPEAVRYAEEIDEYSVEYAQIVSVLAEAIKEQNSKITRLEALVEQLTNN